MKALKYIIFASLCLAGLASCEKKEPTQDEIEAKWPTSITTAEAGDFVLVYRPQEGYSMGDNSLSSSTVKNAKLSKSFYMCTKEVTQAQWVAVMGKNPSDNEYIKAGANKDNCPVNNITYNDAKAFVKKLNEATGRKYAIPKEEQWEWAAMGGKLSSGFIYSGSNNSAEVAWSAVDYEATLNEVAQLKPNELGLYDMSGNIAEWTSSANSIRGGHYESANPEELNVRYNSKTNAESPYFVGLRLIIEEPLSTDK